MRFNIVFHALRYNRKRFNIDIRNPANVCIVRFHESFQFVYVLLYSTPVVWSITATIVNIKCVIINLIIYEEDKKEYYSVLQQYDEQETLEPLVSFLEEQTVKTWNRAMRLSQNEAPQRKGLDFHMM